MRALFVCLVHVNVQYPSICISYLYLCSVIVCLGHVDVWFLSKCMIYLHSFFRSFIFAVTLTFPTHQTHYHKLLDIWVFRHVRVLEYLSHSLLRFKVIFETRICIHFLKYISSTQLVTNIDMKQCIMIIWYTCCIIYFYIHLIFRSRGA